MRRELLGECLRVENPQKSLAGSGSASFPQISSLPLDTLDTSHGTRAGPQPVLEKKVILML